MPDPSNTLNLDPKLAARIQALAKARRQSRNTIVREALNQYLQKEEAAKSTAESKDANTHPSGKPWPRRNPVGGIITPV